MHEQFDTEVYLSEVKWSESRSVVSDSAIPWTSPPGSSVHGISQARILEWVAISSSREVYLRHG